MSAAQDLSNVGVGFNHYVPRLDTIVDDGTGATVTGLCGNTFTLEPVAAKGALAGTHKSAKWPVCPECHGIYDALPSGKSTPDKRPVGAVACESWCTHPEDLGDGTSDDSGCWSAEQAVPAAYLRDGWTVQLQSYVLDAQPDEQTAAEVISESGIVLTQGELHPVVMSPAEARQLAAALIAHADAWEGR